MTPTHRAILALGLLLALPAVAQAPAPSPSPQAVVDAAAQGDVARLEALLAAGASADAVGERGVTALYAAVKVDQPAAAEVLLRAGAGGLGGLHGTPPSHLLSLAAWEGSPALVQVLLKHGADPTALDPDGRDALAEAVAQGSAEKVALLLDAGADPNRLVQEDGISAVARAAIHGHAGLVALLLDRGGSAEVRDHKGITPLMFAASQRREAVVALLLQRGARTWPINAYRTGALTEARRAKDPEVRARLVALLRAAGAEGDDDLRPIDLELFVAAERGDLARVKALVEKGADVHARGIKVGGTSYDTVLFSAVGHPAVVRYLLEQGVDPRQVTEYGFTAIHAAARDGAAESIRLLAERGADPDAVAQGGQVPLGEALNARGERPANVAMLLQVGADPNGRKGADESPLQAARRRKFQRSMALLEKAGAR